LNLKSFSFRDGEFYSTLPHAIMAFAFLNHDIPRIKSILLASNIIAVAPNSLPIMVNVNLCSYDLPQQAL
jgi:hypothetical protein